LSYVHFDEIQSFYEGTKLPQCCNWSFTQFHQIIT